MHLIRNIQNSYKMSYHHHPFYFIRIISEVPSGKSEVLVLILTLRTFNRPSTLLSDVVNENFVSQVTYKIQQISFGVFPGSAVLMEYSSECRLSVQ